MPETKEIKDITIIGGGPTGIFALFYAGMRRATAQIVDALPELGGLALFAGLVMVPLLRRADLRWSPLLPARVRSAANSTRSVRACRVRGTHVYPLHTCK